MRQDSGVARAAGGSRRRRDHHRPRRRAPADHARPHRRSRGARRPSTARPICALPIAETIKRVRERRGRRRRSIARSCGRCRRRRRSAPRCCARRTRRRAGTAWWEPTTPCWWSGSAMQVRVVRGLAENVKITTPEDLRRARRARRPLTRVGFGFDLHPFAARSTARARRSHRRLRSRPRRPLGRRRAVARGRRGAARRAGAGRPGPALSRHRSRATVASRACALLRNVMELVSAQGGRLGQRGCDRARPRRRAWRRCCRRWPSGWPTCSGLEIDRVSVKAKSPEGLGLRRPAGEAWRRWPW